MYLFRGSVVAAGDVRRDSDLPKFRRPPLNNQLFSDFCRAHLLLACEHALGSGVGVCESEN